MTATQPIRILLADDHPPLRKGLALILDNEDDLTVIAEAGNGNEAVALFRQHQPDVALIDLQMPQLTGAQAIASIRAEFVDARLIVLTTYDGDEDIYQGLRAGAQWLICSKIRTAMKLSPRSAPFMQESNACPRLWA